MDGGAFDRLARRMAAPHGRRTLLAAALGGVAALATELLPAPSATVDAAGAGGMRCLRIFQRCRWDDDCCSGECRGGRCGNGARGRRRHSFRKRRRQRRQLRRERRQRRRRLQRRIERRDLRQARREARTAGSAPSAPE